MAKINDHYLKLAAGYLFPEIGRRVNKYAEANPDAKIIRLGIGDVVKALTPSIAKAFHEGVDEMCEDASFKGYGPEQGYEFLRQAIVDNEFKPRGVDIEADEVFVSDGSKCDSGNIQEIFAADATIAVSDPVYPVYVDTNVMAGRSGAANDAGLYDGFVYMPCLEERGFLPEIPDQAVDIVYLCSPNNPTGTVMSKEDLTKWVEYARSSGAIILYDAAYEGFISQPELPHSIFEIEGAKECAIEFRSFSKTAGFTGVRCAFTVVPKALKGKASDGNEVSVRDLWNRRHCTKFNGVSYPVQKAAAAIYSAEGQKEIKELVTGYMENARLIKEALEKKDLKVYGGVNAPYVWLKVPGSSWDFFDTLLEKVQVVGTPGAGFGPSGEGYFRFSAFAHRENVEEAIQRIDQVL